MNKMLVRCSILLTLLTALHTANADTHDVVKQVQVWAELIAHPSPDYINENTSSITRNESVLKWKQLRPMLETYCGMPFYLSEEQTQVTGMRNVNPLIIQCINDAIKSLSEHDVFNDTFEVIYGRFLRGPIREYYRQADRWLMSNSEYLGREVEEQSKLNKLITYTRTTNTIVGSFWQRRKTDGSAPALVEMLETLISRYDPYYHRTMVDYKGMASIKRLQQHGCPTMGSDRQLISCVVTDYYKNQSFVEQCRPSHAARRRKADSKDALAQKCSTFINALRGYLDLKAVITFLGNVVRADDMNAYQEEIGLLKEIVGWESVYAMVSRMDTYEGATLLTDALSQMEYKKDFFEAIYRNKALYQQLVSDLLRQGPDEYGGRPYYMMMGQEAYKLVMALDFLKIEQGDQEAYHLYRDMYRSAVITAEQKAVLKTKLMKTLRFVQASSAMVRKRPNAESELIDKLPIWKPVQVTRTEGDWSHVRYTTGYAPMSTITSGWIYSMLLTTRKLSVEEMMANYRAATDNAQKRSWLERAAATQPYNYQILAELVKVLEEMGDVDTAEIVRKRMRQ